ncbi:IS66 family transposase [Pseudonocardia sp. GCM10023141]|uniref:IS66 family transposase n=1 Tax=Pseudonocardia sp. GCM10023141 TaxID=3252653 RepID=UPI00360C346B
MHRSRGRVAVTEFGVLPDYRGTLVHDSLTRYDAYDQARHGLRGAHLVRELTAAAEAHPDKVWPAQAIRALHQLNNAAHQARDQGLRQIPPEIADPCHRSFRHAVIVGLAEHPRRPGARQSVTRNLLQRLAARFEQVVLFARDLRVPFTNNQAERDLTPDENPAQDQRLSPLRRHRPGLAGQPQLHLHSPQTRPQRPTRTPRRHH